MVLGLDRQDPQGVSQPRIVVLLVDDQAMVGEAVRRALATEPDVDFHYCSRGEEALERALALAPTVILQDLVLPNIDGLALLRTYRAEPRLADTPVIVLSTREEPATKSAAFSTGANDYLVKLPDSIELVARIRYHARLFEVMRQRDAAFQALRDSEQQLMASNAALRRLTQSDGLTGLANRRYFDEYLDTEWRRAARERRELALLMIDVDHFKSYNDTYGHLAGDEVLKRVGHALRESCNRPADLAARYGGEEFAAILPGTSPGGARLIAERIRAAVSGLNIPHTGSTTSPCLSISVGGASWLVADGRPIAALIDEADKRLYEAKRGGRNRVSL